MFVISEDEEICTGLRFAGIDGIVVSGEEEFKAAFNEAVQNPEVGIVLVTEYLRLQYEKNWMQAACGEREKLFVTLPMWKEQKRQRELVGKPGME